METIIGRIKKIIENENVSVRVFEEKIGTSQGVINKSINANADIKGSLLNRIVEIYPHYNLEWIITGNGDMIKTDDDFLETVNKLKSFYEKFKSKWAAILADRKKTVK